MKPFDPNELPPICTNWATDVLSSGTSSLLENTVASDGLRAAIVSRTGNVAIARCKVMGCNVACKIFSVIEASGEFRATGVSSEDDETDLSNCPKS